MRLKLTLEYDGTHFHGWALQPGLRTVEGVLRDALGAFPSFAGLAVAGRTDTGVHALGNVVSVDVEGGPPAPAQWASSCSRTAATYQRLPPSWVNASSPSVISVFGPLVEPSQPRPVRGS